MFGNNQISTSNQELLDKVTEGLAQVRIALVFDCIIIKSKLVNNALSAKKNHVKILTIIEVYSYRWDMPQNLKLEEPQLCTTEKIHEIVNFIIKNF